MKKIIMTAFVVAIVTAGYSVLKHSLSTRGMSEQELANVEALTDGEGQYDFKDGQASRFDCGARTGSNIIGNNQNCKYQVVLCQSGGSGCNQRRCPDHG